MTIFGSGFAQLDAMTSKDIVSFGLALIGTVGVGALLLLAVFRWLDGVVNNGRPSPAAPNTGQPPAAKSTASTKPAPKLPTKIPRPKRNIPAAAAASMVERGHRLREEKNFAEALKCYLALLFCAVEDGTKTAALPKHLTDCLRGAAECYKGLDEYEKAVRFLQAERMIYEEMLAQEQKLRSGVEGSTSILRTLFDGKDPSAQPHRCEVLNGVAEASLKLGYTDLGLSYRVKAAALKHRLSGKPLDPQSPEVVAIAEAMDRCEESRRQSEPGQHDLVGVEPQPPRPAKKPRRERSKKPRSEDIATAENPNPSAGGSDAEAEE